MNGRWSRIDDVPRAHRALLAGVRLVQMLRLGVPCVGVQCVGVLRVGVLRGLLASLLAFAVAGCDRPAEPLEAEPEPPRIETTGVDSLLIGEAFSQAREIPRLRTLLVARHGEILAELHKSGPPPSVPTNVKSVSKSILSALVGIAIDEGYLSGSGQPVYRFFDEYLGPDVDQSKRTITIADLLSMQSGLERTSGGNYGAWVTSSNWVRYAITRPMVAEPGGRRMYSTGNSHLLSAILTEATGRSTWEYAREKLAAPMGIHLPPWMADPQGIYFGGNEMRMSPRAMVRFGELYRLDGRLDGRQIVPAWWVQESLTPRTEARRPGEGYGYSWFLSEISGYSMFYAWGYGGQFIFVIPDLELTVVSTADVNVSGGGSHLRTVRQLLANYVVPAAERGGRHDHVGTAAANAVAQHAQHAQRTQLAVNSLSNSRR